MKIASEFKKESHIADSHFRQFIEKVHVQFQELTIVNEAQNNESDFEMLIAADSVSSTKQESEKSESAANTTNSFVHAVKLQPQSTKKDTRFTQQPQQVKINEEIYVESYDLVDADHIQEAEELEETIEEYQTVAESPQVVYISLDNKAEYPFAEQSQNASNVEENSSKECQPKNQQNDETHKSEGNQHYCSQCKKSFSTKTNLFRHVATHGT